MARQKTLTAPTTFSTLPPGTKARITDDYALYAGQTCAVAARPSHDAAIVELESGARERIPVKYLEQLLEEPECFQEYAALGVGEETSPPAAYEDEAVAELEDDRPCSHDFKACWGYNELIEVCCICGERRPPSIESIEQFLDICRSAREDYAKEAEKSRGKKKLEMDTAVRDRAEQIVWLTQRLEELKPKPVAVEVVGDELSPDEERERHHLERKVERAFYEAGKALAEIRDRRLYRSTHKTFEAYCKDRFGFNRISAHNKIAAAQVMENLFSNAEQKDDDQSLFSIAEQKLPTSERQCLPLAALEPDEQRSIWNELTADGRLPSGKAVKEQVNKYKNRNAPPPAIPYQEGDVVMIRGMGDPDLRKHDGRWAIVVRVNNYTVTVSLKDEERAVHPQFLESVDPEYWEDIRAIHQRITNLQKCELDPADDAVLEVLKRRLWFTERQKLLLQRMEEDYGTEGTN